MPSQNARVFGLREHAKVDGRPVSVTSRALSNPGTFAPITSSNQQITFMARLRAAGRTSASTS
jgi:hypothetical protein